MSELSIQQVQNSRFRTSAHADRTTVTLMENLGLSTKANVARLAIGRSLALGALNADDIDAKGLEIPATSIFTHDDLPLWMGLMVTHARMHGADKIDSMDAFRSAVRRHWHRGVGLLMEDWDTNGGNFDRFLETLIKRRADLPEVASTSVREAGPSRPVEKPEDISAALLKALEDIGVVGEVKSVHQGPRVARYTTFLPEINQHDKLRNGLERLGLILGLQKTLPLLSPGDEPRTVFIDIPRPRGTWSTTGYSDLYAWAAASPSDRNQLLVFPGVDVMGTPFSFDLTTAPHVLVGGATGQGKSVCLHAMILSLIMRHAPASLRLALIDPKQVEFSVYKGSKYLHGEDVAVGIAAARKRISELVNEMDSRYKRFEEAGVTNILEARQKGFDLPFIAVFIEELADLVLQDKDLEKRIVRLAQLARAAGIHMVLATQRPDAKTFSGLIRSNIPTRIALTVQKRTESSIILDEIGAESLLGAGDMLVKKPGEEISRVHGVFISRIDIEKFLSANR